METDHHRLKVSPGSPDERTPASKSTTEHSFDSVQPVQVPKVLLGHGSNVVTSLPTILRYWDKVHVTPLNGPKDVQAIAVISDAGGIQQVGLSAEWLNQVGKVYGVSNIIYQCSKANHIPRLDGLVPTVRRKCRCHLKA